MSNFSALKTAIQAAIKQNGNNEITGDILQDILLSIVSTLGDSAINTLEQGLQTESQTRGNDDAALSQAIEGEATARGNQDTQLGNLITGIKNNIDNGYVYAGIATPSTTPVSGKVFYIATQAGTYTNLGNTAVKPGISILKYNGSAWSNEQVIYTDGGVFDVSAYNGGATYASLEALLSDANLSTIIPSAVRKGGMSIKFVSTVDNKYVQYRLMKDTWSTLITDWQNMGDFVEESEHPIADNDVAGYLTDKNMSVIGKLMKSGAVEWLMENSKDIANNAHFESIDELLSYVSSEVPDSDNGVIKYLTDKDGKVIATINNVGDTEFKGGGGFDGELTKSNNIAFDAVKVVTDNKGSIIGWITSEGKIHIEELDVKLLNVEGGADIGIPEQLFPLLGIVASGTENHKFVNNKTLNLFFSQKGEYRKDGIKIETYPVISINDDDAIDYQMPTSYEWNATNNTRSSYNKIGGYASLLWPLLNALNTKHTAIINGKLTCGVCSEGQRIGLTPLYSLEDTFAGELNANGKMVKALVEHEGWECILHSMTARYISHSYLVNGLDSEFANSLLIDAVYRDHNGLGYATTTCYDTVTKKNYKVKQNLSGWDECPLHYAKPYLAVSKEVNSRLVINPTYSVKYQVKTWMDRADVAHLPYINMLQGWGNSHGSWHITEDMKYVDTVVDGTSRSRVNTVPYKVCPYRYPWGVISSDDGYNVYNKNDYKEILDIIDICIETKGWCILRGHIYEAQYRNYYQNAYDELYGADAADCGALCYKDDSYPEEWIVPLKYAELMDMLGDNVNDYWHNPPARLNIQSWADWYPCPGTTLAMLYDALEYAIERGVKFSSMEDVLKDFGNLLAIGCETINTLEPDLRLAPEDNVTSYCRIGADGSVVYRSNQV